MKRLIICLLILSMLVSMFSCAEAPAVSKTEEAANQTVENAETEEAKETAVTETAEADPVYNEKVSEPLTPERVAQIPIANSSMTTDELRQICVDYVCLSTTFQWLPSKTFTYVTSSVNLDVKFYEGKLYGGIPYVNIASGNLYRVLEMYDPETGIMNIDNFAENSDKKIYFGTACSGTACWGWGRVVNSADLRWTSNMNQKHGFIPVGPYTYDASIAVYGENGAEDCKPICRRNGQQTMFESYALLQKADCIVNQGHVRMIKGVHVVRNADGTINGDESYAIQCEQGLYTTDASHDRVAADGTVYKIQGQDHMETPFSALFESGYLPHTFAEFLGTDPVEPGIVHIDHSGPTISASDVKDGILSANYNISDVFTVVKNEQGEEVYRYAYRCEQHFDRAAGLSKAISAGALQTFSRQGNHTVDILVQLSNGELITAYSGALVA
ncbi:MAG: hypothetical protein IKD18_02935 [Clostridia bacterium]|nr:hypothetical protein [Clostridia bacterium]